MATKRTAATAGGQAGDTSGGGAATEDHRRALGALQRLLGRIKDACGQFVAGHDKAKHEFTSFGPDGDDVHAAAEYLRRLGLTADARRLDGEAKDLMVQATRWAMRDLAGDKRRRWESAFGKLPACPADPADKAKFLQTREMSLLGQATRMREHVDDLLRDVETNLARLDLPPGGGQNESVKRGARQPTDLELAIAADYEKKGGTMEDLVKTWNANEKAKKLLAEAKTGARYPLTAPKVSRIVNKVNRWRRKMGQPAIPTRRKGKAVAAEPDKIEQGARNHKGTGLRQQGQRQHAGGF